MGGGKSNSCGVWWLPATSFSFSKRRILTWNLEYKVAEPEKCQFDSNLALGSQRVFVIIKLYI